MTHETADVNCPCDPETCMCCEACVCKGNKDIASMTEDEYTMREKGVVE